MLEEVRGYSPLSGFLCCSAGIASSHSALCPVKRIVRPIRLAHVSTNSR
jgi:hypothetical protein